MQNNRAFDTGVDGAIYPFVASVGFAILFIKLFQTAPLPSLPWQVMVAIGQRSFSIYIFHFFVLDIVRFAVPGIMENAPPVLAASLIFAVTVPLTFGVAALSYRWVEKPGIALGARMLTR